MYLLKDYLYVLDSVRNLQICMSWHLDIHPPACPHTDPVSSDRVISTTTSDGKTIFKIATGEPSAAPIASYLVGYPPSWHGTLNVLTLHIHWDVKLEADIIPEWSFDVLQANMHLWAEIALKTFVIGNWWVSVA